MLPVCKWTICGLEFTGFVPFRSSFSNWLLPLIAFATIRAASLVISPKDRLSSCQRDEGIIDLRGGFGVDQPRQLCFSPRMHACASGRHLQDGEASRHTLGDGAGPGGPQEAVAEVDHLDAVQVFQGLRETRGGVTCAFDHATPRNEPQMGFLPLCRTYVVVAEGTIKAYLFLIKHLIQKWVWFVKCPLSFYTH